MTITTNRGQEFKVNWAWADEETGILRIELPDTRTIGEIAEDFDGLGKIERKSEEEGDKVYMGYNVLSRVIRNIEKGTVQLTMEKNAVLSPSRKEA